MKTITEMMKIEHKRINKMLEEADEAKADNEKLTKLFSKFKWNLEKHLVIEEKAIFAGMGDIQGKEVSEVFNLIMEHNGIRNSIKMIEDRLSDPLVPDFSGLKESIMKHEEFEDTTFYPMLDEILNPQQIEEIIKKSKEIIAG